MSKYIDREAFKSKYLCCGYLPEMSEEEFDEFPAADVVEVVRCRDCKYYRERAGLSMCAERAVRLDGHEVGLLATYKNNFCSFGKRR